MHSVQGYKPGKSHPAVLLLLLHGDVYVGMVYIWLVLHSELEQGLGVDFHFHFNI